MELFKIGDTYFQTYVIIILFSITIFFQKLFYMTILQKIARTYLFLLFTLGYTTKLTSGIFECFLQRDFNYKLKASSKLLFKDYWLYAAMILLELCSNNAHLFFDLKTVRDYFFQNVEDIRLSFDFLFSTFEIFIICIGSFYFLKYKIGKHKLAGLIIIFVGLIVPIPKYVDDSTNYLNTQFYILIKFFIYNFEAAAEVIEKYLLLYKSQSPYLLLFLQGLFQTIISLIFLFINLGKTNNADNPNNEENPNWYVIMLIYIGFIIVEGAYHYLRIAVIYKLTPTHKIVSSSLAYFAFFIFYFVKELKWENLFGMIGFCICIIGSLIYNEIIVFTLWDIDKDTKENITERALQEEKETMNVMKSFSEEKDDFKEDLVDEEKIEE